jgi:hypothetical protein
MPLYLVMLRTSRRMAREACGQAVRDEGICQKSLRDVSGIFIAPSAG